MRRVWLAALCAAEVVAAAGSARSAVIAGVTSDAPYVASYSNEMRNNFLVELTLSTETVISGMYIDAAPGFAAPGQAVTIKVRDDVGGSPSSANLYEIQTDLNSFVDVSPREDFVGADFNVDLAAGSYWIGMSGATSELGWVAYDHGQTIPPGQTFLQWDEVTSDIILGSLGYAIVSGPVTSDDLASYLTASSVSPPIPEPASWAMLISGFGAIGAIQRRRRAAPI
jgi:hypothetical protein